MEADSRESCGQRPLEAAESTAQKSMPSLAPVSQAGRPLFPTLEGTQRLPLPGGGLISKTGGQGDSRERFPSALFGPSGFPA